mmetsp:Transcript_29675/g.64274  ORF Transcript_29675/g.64274 Transcript_29675/m.64274 type:complete len:94 (+) Transcript_29675:676-957(+)
MFRSAVMKQSQGGKHMNEKSLHDTTNILTDPAPCTRNGIDATIETSHTSPLFGRGFDSDMLHSLRNERLMYNGPDGNKKKKYDRIPSTVSHQA